MKICEIRLNQLAKDDKCYESGLYVFGKPIFSISKCIFNVESYGIYDVNFSWGGSIITLREAIAKELL